MPPPSPPPHQAARPISPELALVDRALVVPEVAEPAHEATAARLSCGVLDDDAREAMLRVCELSDVNPPRARGGRLVLAVTAPAVLWVEAVLVVASFVPLGTL